MCVCVVLQHYGVGVGKSGIIMNCEKYERSLHLMRM